MDTDFIHSFWRPACGIVLIFGVVIVAIAETAGVGTAPTWFLGFALPVASGLFIERAIRKGKKDG